MSLGMNRISLRASRYRGEARTLWFEVNYLTYLVSIERIFAKYTVTV